MKTRPWQRRGVSLLELLVVVVLLGIFASVAAMRFGRTMLGDFGSNAAARELSLALLACQRSSIKTGDNHFLDFTIEGSRATSYRMFRDHAGVKELIDGPRALPSDVTVTVSHPQMVFTFEGSAQDAYKISLAGANRVWQLTVVPITGAVRVAEVKKTSQVRAAPLPRAVLP